MKRVRKIKQVENNLTITHPELAEEWHPNKNGFGPDCVTKGSHRMIVWLGKCGHEWSATVNSRTYQGNGCPYCGNRKLLEGFNDFTTRFPELAKEWHPTKNKPLDPSTILHRREAIWWKCSVCGYEWSAIIGNRIYGRGCPACANKRKGNRTPRLHGDGVDKSEKESATST